MSHQRDRDTPANTTPHNAQVNSGLVVRDRAALAHWWQQLPGGDIAWTDDARDLTCVTWQGYPLLLAGPHADPTPHLRYSARPQPPGSTVLLILPDASSLDTLATALHDLGLPLTQIQRTAFPWGTHTLRIPLPVAPDEGYTLTFTSQQERSPDAWLADFRRGPDLLEAAIAGLDNAALDLQPLDRIDDSAWSIRQITHHIADMEVTGLLSNRFALAEPGRSVIGNGYDQDVWAAALDYAHRDIAPALALFRAARAWTTQLLDHFPDAWERTTRSADGTSFPVGSMVAMLTAHALGHIVDIHDIRTAHGLPAASRPDHPHQPEQA